MPPALDLAGQRFGRLVVMNRAMTFRVPTSVLLRIANPALTATPTEETRTDG